MLDEFISQTEANAMLVSGQYYKALANNEKESISKLRKEKASLLSSLQIAMESGTIAKNSEQWVKMVNAIDEVTLAIEEGNTRLVEYNQTLQQLDWEVFDILQERISNVAEEAEFLIDLMSNDKLYSDNGQLTDEGMATMGLHGQNYNVYMHQADKYAKEISDLNKEIAKDPYDQDLVNRRNELIELQQESILAAEDEKNAIRDMVEEGIELELDALQELIDKRNEALESQKDLYDYQKKVAEQTSEISSLEKQMSAYAGDNSEEAKAKIQEIKVSLEEAKADLEESEYDKYISDQQQLLDELYLEYETILNTRLDNVDALLTQMIAEINANAMAINDTLNAQANNVGYILSTEMQNIWGLAAMQMQNDAAKRVEETTQIINQLVKNGQLSQVDAQKIVTALGTGDASAVTNTTNVINQLIAEGKLSKGNADLLKNTVTSTGNEYKGVITTYSDKFTLAQTTTNNALNTINTNLQNMITQLNKVAKTNVKSASISSAANSKQATAKKKTNTANKNVFTSGNSGGDGTPKIGDKVKFVSGQYYYDSQGKRPLGNHKQGQYVYITNINKKDWATHPYHISTGNKLGKGDLGWLKLNQISGYATGKKNFASNEIAWTQENAQEYIIRPSDGAILTPIAKGDSVLNATASKNLWDMANNPSEFIKENLNLGAANVPNNSNVHNNYTQNLENVVFSLPNVQNYDELLSTLQKDKNFERLILSMSIDRLAGKSALAKNKAIR